MPNSFEPISYLILVQLSGFPRKLAALVDFLIFYVNKWIYIFEKVKFSVKLEKEYYISEFYKLFNFIAKKLKKCNIVLEFEV